MTEYTQRIALKKQDKLWTKQIATAVIAWDKLQKNLDTTLLEKKIIYKNVPAMIVFISGQTLKKSLKGKEMIFTPKRNKM